MTKILIPTDFSSNSYQTIDYITSLFIDEYCEFYFLNTYSHDVMGLSAIELLQADDDFFDQPKVASLKELRRMVQRYSLNSNPNKHTFFAISESDDFLKSIKSNIKTIGIDMVVVSSDSDKAVEKKNGIILDKIRSCPILIVPMNAISCEGISLTIASDFKHKTNTYEIDNFVKTLENTTIEIGILVLVEKYQLQEDAATNLESLINYLKQLSNKEINIEYIQSSYPYKAYAESHLGGIMCLLDKKPDLLRKIGFYKSNVISTIGKLSTNTVLTIHQ